MLRSRLCLLFFLALPVLCFLTALPVPAQDGPAFDCAKADGRIEEMICADSALAALDRLVTQRHEGAVSMMKAIDAGSDTAVNDLRALQRGWIEGRNDCWKATDPRACTEAAYLRREGELVAGYMLTKPASRTRWQCDGAAADEIVTDFFATTQPSLRLELGGRVATASLTSSASGARYDGAFGEFLWIKGDEATYRSPDPEGQETTCTVAG